MLSYFNTAAASLQNVTGRASYVPATQYNPAFAQSTPKNEHILEDPSQNTQHGKCISQQLRQYAHIPSRPAMQTTVGSDNGHPKARSSSHLSWPESPYSRQPVPPQVVDDLVGKASSRSSTPESVRKLIKETGVFRYTSNKELPATSTSTRPLQVPAQYMNQELPDLTLRGQSQIRKGLTMNPVDHVPPTTPLSQHGDDGRPQREQSSAYLEAGTHSHNIRRTRVQVWDEQKGWINENPDEPADDRPSLPTTLNRQELAQLARVKVPSEDEGKHQSKAIDRQNTTDTYKKVLRNEDIPNETNVVVADGAANESATKVAVDSINQHDPCNNMVRSDTRSTVRPEQSPTTGQKSTEEMYLDHRQQISPRQYVTHSGVESAHVQSPPTPGYINIPVRGNSQHSTAAMTITKKMSSPLIVPLRPTIHALPGNFSHQPFRTSRLSNVLNADDLGSPVPTQTFATDHEDLDDIRHDGADSNYQPVFRDKVEGYTYGGLDHMYNYEDIYNEQQCLPEPPGYSQTQSSLPVFDNTYEMHSYGERPHGEHPPNSYGIFNLWQPFRQY